MQKRLYLMRHAKSSWKNPLPDHERPLNRRGKEAAVRIGRALVRQHFTPELILSSDAKRARATAKRVLRAFEPDHRPALRLDPALYDADASTILREIAATEDRIDNLMVIGHNPGISRLALLLTGDSSLEWLPTGAVIGIKIKEKTWKEIGTGNGKLFLRLSPRELEE